MALAISCHEPAFVPAQQRQIGHHVVDAAFPRQGIGAFAPQFRTALAVAVLHYDDQLAAAREQVHRAADAATLRVRCAPVGNAAGLINLIGSEDHGVDSAAARHLERGNAVEERLAGLERDEREIDKLRRNPAGLYDLVNLHDCDTGEQFYLLTGSPRRRQLSSGGVSRQAIYKLMRKGRLRSIVIGGHTFVSRADVLSFRSWPPQISSRQMTDIQQIKHLLTLCSPAQRQEVYRHLRKEFPIHPLEVDLNTDAEIILEAIHRSGGLHFE